MPSSVKSRPEPACVMPMSGIVVRAGPSRGSTSSRNSSRLAPVAARILATDSVDGQRSRPSGLTRFERLKLVASRPAFRARPEAERLYRWAKRSMAAQTRA